MKTTGNRALFDINALKETLGMSSGPDKSIETVSTVDEVMWTGSTTLSEYSEYYCQLRRDRRWDFGRVSGQGSSQYCVYIYGLLMKYYLPSKGFVPTGRDAHKLLNLTSTFFRCVYTHIHTYTPNFMTDSRV